MMDLIKNEELIFEILCSNKFEIEIFMELRGLDYYDNKENIGYIWDILEKQYMDTNIKNIFEKHDQDKIIDFLNRLIYLQLVDKKKDEEPCISIAPEELKEFRVLAEQTNKISNEDLSKEAPILTVKTYLDMCRVAYDAAPEWSYPSDISNAYLFCEARMFDFTHEYDEGILGGDWDSPEQFARRYASAYHKEELRFGGPRLWLYDKSGHIDENTYRYPPKYAQWVGYFSCITYDKRTLSEGIKMYIALRKKGYPIYFSAYEETLWLG